jgi:hypothetical protein
MSMDSDISMNRRIPQQERGERRVAELLEAAASELAYRVASVSLQMIKSMNTLYTDTKPQERLEIAKEYKLALTAYLENRLTS